MLNKNLKPDKVLSAVCGLYCPSCSLYIGTIEDPSRLEVLAKQWGKSIEDVTCYGCRSEKRSFFCESICKMSKCSKEKGIDFCSQCDEYPCNELKDFQVQLPHRIELWDSLKNIKENGYEKWFLDMNEKYSCKSCETINSVYEIKCRKCGEIPGNNFVKNHKKEIENHLNK